MKYSFRIILLLLFTIFFAGCANAGSAAATGQISNTDSDQPSISMEEDAGEPELPQDYSADEQPQDDVSSRESSDEGSTQDNADEQSPEGALLPHETSTDSSEETADSSEDSQSTGWQTIADIKNKDIAALITSYTSTAKSLKNEALKNTYNNRYFHHENGFVTYDDPDYECLTGIDVSSFQSEIDWEAVRAQGISFAFIRLGYRGYGESGTLNEDELYRQNLEGAKEAGLLVGAYFFSQAVNEEEAEEEADFALQLLDGFPLDLPLVFDAEYIRDDEARTDSVLLSQFTKNARAFCEKVSYAGYDACVYATIVWELLIYDLEQLIDYPIWFAGYDPVPKTPYTFTFWQYSEKGSVEGIDEIVDLDIWIRKK